MAKAESQWIFQEVSLGLGRCFWDFSMMTPHHVAASGVLIGPKQSTHLPAASGLAVASRMSRIGMDRCSYVFFVLKGLLA